MTSRQQRRQDSEARVLAAALRVFTDKGYAAATIPLIAAEAGVSVGTVASVGSKDALFLRTWEENATAWTLDVIAEAASVQGSVTERVWAYMSRHLEGAIAAPDAIRDYLVAYLRSSDHTDNLGRLDQVLAALRGLFPEPGDLDDRSAATLATTTIYLAFSALTYSLAANSVAPEQARQAMHAIVAAQCAPFEPERP